MELDLPVNFGRTILGEMESAFQLWSAGEKSRLTINPIKVQSATSQLRPSSFSDDKYVDFNFKTANAIGGSGFL